MDKSNRLSILKPPKARNPLCDLSKVGNSEDQTALRSKRVSFACNNSIKPFASDPDKNTIWDSTYEEILQTSDPNSTQATTFVEQQNNQIVSGVSQNSKPSISFNIVSNPAAPPMTLQTIQMSTRKVVNFEPAISNNNFFLPPTITNQHNLLKSEISVEKPIFTKPKDNPLFPFNISNHSVINDENEPPKINPEIASKIASLTCTSIVPVDKENIVQNVVEYVEILEPNIKKRALKPLLVRQEFIVDDSMELAIPQDLAMSTSFYGNTEDLEVSDTEASPVTLRPSHVAKELDKNDTMNSILAACFSTKPAILPNEREPPLIIVSEPTVDPKSSFESLDEVTDQNKTIFNNSDMELSGMDISVEQSEDKSKTIELSKLSFSCKSFDFQSTYSSKSKIELPQDSIAPQDNKNLSKVLPTQEKVEHLAPTVTNNASNIPIIIADNDSMSITLTENSLLNIRDPVNSMKELPSIIHIDSTNVSECTADIQTIENSYGNKDSNKSPLFQNIINKSIINISGCESPAQFSSLDSFDISSDDNKSISRTPVKTVVNKILRRMSECENKAEDQPEHVKTNEESSSPEYSINKPIGKSDSQQTNDPVVTNKEVEECIFTTSKKEISSTELQKEISTSKIINAFNTSNEGLSIFPTTSKHEISSKQVQKELSPLKIINAFNISNERLSIFPTTSKHEISSKEVQKKVSPLNIINAFDVRNAGLEGFTSRRDSNEFDLSDRTLHNIEIPETQDICSHSKPKQNVLNVSIAATQELSFHNEIEGTELDIIPETQCTDSPKLQNLKTQKTEFDSNISMDLTVPETQDTPDHLELLCEPKVDLPEIKFSADMSCNMEMTEALPAKLFGSVMNNVEPNQIEQFTPKRLPSATLECSQKKIKDNNQETLDYNNVICDMEFTEALPNVLKPNLSETRCYNEFDLSCNMEITEAFPNILKTDSNPETSSCDMQITQAFSNEVTPVSKPIEVRKCVKPEEIFSPSDMELTTVLSNRSDQQERSEALEQPVPSILSLIKKKAEEPKQVMDESRMEFTEVLPCFKNKNICEESVDFDTVSSPSQVIQNELMDINPVKSCTKIRLSSNIINTNTDLSDAVVIEKIVTNDINPNERINVESLCTAEEIKNTIEVVNSSKNPLYETNVEDKVGFLKLLPEINVVPDSQIPSDQENHIKNVSFDNLKSVNISTEKINLSAGENISETNNLKSEEIDPIQKLASPKRYIELVNVSKSPGQEIQVLPVSPKKESFKIFSNDSLHNSNDKDNSDQKILGTAVKQFNSPSNIPIKEEIQINEHNSIKNYDETNLNMSIDEDTIPSKNIPNQNYSKRDQDYNEPEVLKEDEKPISTSFNMSIDEEIQLSQYMPTENHSKSDQNSYNENFEIEKPISTSLNMSIDQEIPFSQNSPLKIYANDHQEKSISTFLNMSIDEEIQFTQNSPVKIHQDSDHELLELENKPILTSINTPIDHETRNPEPNSNQTYNHTPNNKHDSYTEIDNKPVLTPIKSPVDQAISWPKTTGLSTVPMDLNPSQTVHITPMKLDFEESVVTDKDQKVKKCTKSKIPISPFYSSAKRLKPRDTPEKHHFRNFDMNNSMEITGISPLPSSQNPNEPKDTSNYLKQNDGTDFLNTSEDAIINNSSINTDNFRHQLYGPNPPLKNNDDIFLVPKPVKEISVLLADESKVSTGSEKCKFDVMSQTLNADFLDDEAPPSELAFDVSNQQIRRNTYVIQPSSPIVDLLRLSDSITDRNDSFKIESNDLNCNNTVESTEELLNIRAPGLQHDFENREISTVSSPEKRTVVLKRKLEASPSVPVLPKKNKHLDRKPGHSDIKNTLREISKKKTSLWTAIVPEHFDIWFFSFHRKMFELRVHLGQKLPSSGDHKAIKSCEFFTNRRIKTSESEHYIIESFKDRVPIYEKCIEFLYPSTDKILELLEFMTAHIQELIKLKTKFDSLRIMGCPVYELLDKSWMATLEMSNLEPMFVLTIKIDITKIEKVGASNVTIIDRITSSDAEVISDIQSIIKTTKWDSDYFFNVCKNIYNYRKTLKNVNSKLI